VHTGPNRDSVWCPIGDLRWMRHLAYCGSCLRLVGVTGHELPARRNIARVARQELRLGRVREDGHLIMRNKKDLKIISRRRIRLITILCALLIGVTMGPALSPLRHVDASTVRADTSPAISIGPIEGQFYKNCCDNGVVDINYGGRVDTPLFTEQFPVIDFNPSQDTRVACSNSTGVNEYSRPMVDVIPQADGTCKFQTIEGADIKQASTSLRMWEPQAPSRRPSIRR